MLALAGIVHIEPYVNISDDFLECGVIWTTSSPFAVSGLQGFFGEV